MSEFDSQLWKNRAWARYTHALCSGQPLQKIEPEWAHDILAIGDLDLLTRWCTERKVTVDFVKKQCGTYYSGTKTITISSRLSPRNQVIVLLHECGHHLIGPSGDSDRFQMGYAQVDHEITKTFHHRVSCLEEEMEAWHRGWRLSCRLALRVDREVFDEYRLKCLKSYIKWTIKPGKFDFPKLEL